MCDSWPVSGSSTASPASSRVRARTSSSRAAFRRSADASRADFAARAGSCGTLQGEQRRPHEQLDADERGDGVSREPEDERRAADCRRPRACPAGRPRPRSPPRLRAPRAIRRTRSCGPTETPPELTSTSAASPRSSAARCARLVVGDRADPLDECARGLERRRQHRARSTRRSDRARASRPARAAPYPVLRTATAGRRVHSDLARPLPLRARRSARRRAPCRPRAGRSPSTDVASARPDVRSGRNGIRDLDRCCLVRQHARSARRRRLPRARRPRSRSPSPRRARAGGRRAGRRRSGRRPAGGRAVSPARTAKPSIAELANGGRSTRAATSSASTRPAAASTGTRSASSGAAQGEHAREGVVDGEQRSGIGRTYANCRDLGRSSPCTTRSGASRSLHDELAAALDPLDQSWEVVFVDDGSTDGTFAALTRLHAERTTTFASCGCGATSARPRRCRRASQARRARSSSRSTATSRTTRPRSRGCSRSSTRASTSSRAGRRSGATRSAAGFRRGSSTSSPAALSGLRLHDLNCGLKAYRAEVVRGLRIYGELHRFIPVLAHYRGFRVAELPVNHRPREHGRSRYGMERYVRGLPRPAHGHLHGPLPAPAAAPVRRPGAAAGLRSGRCCSST